MQAVPVPADAPEGFDPARDLPHVAGAYTTGPMKLLRQRLAVRRETIAAAQQTGSLDSANDPELLAHAALVFILGLMHMEALARNLAGDARWRAFVEDRPAALLGELARNKGATARTPGRNPSLVGPWRDFARRCRAE